MLNRIMKESLLKADARVVSFVLRFCVLLMAAVGLSYAALDNGLFQSVMNNWAMLVGSILKVFKLPVEIVEQKVVLPGVFGIDISLECSGVPHLLLFFSAVFAYPTTMRMRLLGALLAMIAVFTINLLRLIALFMTGINAPELFDIAHLYIWGGVSYIALTVVWLLWLQYANAQSPILRN